jgi:hypothetical protein
MRIHSSKITTQDIYHAAATSPGVYAEVTTHGSRSHGRAFEVRLESNGTPDLDGTSRRRRTNAGTSDVDRFILPYAASWSDWGRMLATLFDIDPEARCTYYANREDFHRQTVGRFLPGGESTGVNSSADAWRASRANA